MKLLLTRLSGLILLLSLFLGLFSGCATEEKNLNTAEGLFNHAKEFDDAERYEMAITKYAEVKNRFPYSTLATTAELAIADVYFKKESFQEAQLSYQNFRDLHPKHSKIDYVIYKIAMSYYMQLPETFDRDLSPGTDAIYHFNELVKSYPKSDYATEAKTKSQEVYEKLAEKELYIADFYFKQEKMTAALRRYEATVEKYTGYGFDPRAHLGAARAAKALGDTTKQKLHSKTLFSKYKNSSEAKTAENEGL